MIDSLSIRSAQIDDVEVLTMIRREAILALAAGKIGGHYAHDWANSAAPNRLRRAIEVHRVCVAEIAPHAVLPRPHAVLPKLHAVLQSKQPIGWVEVDGNRVVGLYVRPERANQGVGSVLLAHEEEQIWSAGYPSVVLDASWNAEQFYINRGYQPLSERSPDSGRPMVKLPAPHTVSYQAYMQHTTMGSCACPKRVSSGVRLYRKIRLILSSRARRN